MRDAILQTFLSVISSKFFTSRDVKGTSGKKVTLEDCQTWLVEAAGYLVEDRMFSPEVAVYLHVIKQ